MTFRLLRSYPELLADAGQEPAEISTVRGSKYRQILRIKAVHFLAIFSVIYIGVSVTVGGMSSYFHGGM